MAETKTTTSGANGMKVDTKLVRELAELLAETGLSEIEAGGGKPKVRGARPLTSSPAPQKSQAAPAPAPAAPAPVPAGAPAAADNANAVRSPMVGTAYLSPDPESAAFVSV